MPLSGSAFWGVILPFQQTNLFVNPSFERGTFGVTDVNIESLGTESFYQQFGAWSLDIVTDNAQNESVAGVGTWTSGQGTAYTVSAYVRGDAGKRIKMAVGTANNSITGASIAGSVTIDAGGTWHRYNIPYTEASTQNRRLLVWGSDYGQAHIYVDGVNVTAGSLSTHIDGDQEGCYWLGLPHQSQSVRSGTYRGGGSVVALADLGLKPYQHVGIGMPPQEVTAQSYALQPGAEYQRSRASERPFTISFQPILGTTQKDFHAVRRRIIDAFKPDLLDPQQPVRFWYTGGVGTVQIDAVYAGGLELGEMNGPMVEEGAVKFIAHDPYWYATTQQGTALAGRIELGSTNFLAKRSPLGLWGTLGIAGTTVNSDVDALNYANGTLYIGGRFGSAGGTLTGSLIFYRTDVDRFGTFGGTVATSGGVQAIAVDAAGTVIFGGAFGGISGLSNTRFIARWSAGFATIIGGTTNNDVNDMVWSGGTLVIGGNFTGVAGTTTGGLAFWRPSGYGSTSNGTIGAQIFGVGIGLNRTVYVGFQGAGAVVAGTAGTHVAQYFGSWGTMGVGVQESGAGVQSVAVGPNGVVYVGGEFTTAGGGSALNVAQWNGRQWFPMGSGVGQDTAGVIEVNKMFVDQLTGDVYAGGGVVSNPYLFPDAISRWNGYVWLPLDIDFQGGDAPRAIAQAPDRTLYFGGGMTGTAYAASVAQVVNTGVGEAFPTVKLRNTSGATRRLYQFGNTLTGDMIFLNTTLEPGEEVTLITKPGARSFTSSLLGNIFGNILPGSNISSLRLMPGTNYVSLFCDSGSVAASIYWNPRSDSVDGGTIY